LVAKRLQNIPHQLDKKNNIVCPINEHGNGDQLSVQLISEDLKRPKLKAIGKPCKGGYWFINDHIPTQPRSRVIIAEGFSTGWAIYLMCHKRIPVAVSYGCSAMGLVAIDVRDFWGCCPVLAPDNGATLPDNCEGFDMIAIQGCTHNYDWCDWRIDHPDKTPLQMQRICDDPICAGKIGLFGDYFTQQSAPDLVQVARKGESLEEGC
jgi:hypothetical protein